MEALIAFGIGVCASLDNPEPTEPAPFLVSQGYMSFLHLPDGRIFWNTRDGIIAGKPWLLAPAPPDESVESLHQKEWRESLRCNTLSHGP